MKSRSPASIEDMILSESLGSERDLDVDESNIALRICYAFKSKRTYMRSFKVGKEFTYKTLENSCIGEENESTVNVVLFENDDENSLEFLGKEKQIYLNKVMTDRDGAMSYICNGLFQGKTVSNTHIKDESQKIQFEFMQVDNHDMVKVIHGIKGVDNFGSIYYSISYIDSYEIESTPSKTELTGVAIKASRSFPCGSGDGTNDLIQVLVTD